MLKGMLKTVTRGNLFDVPNAASTSPYVTPPVVIISIFGYLAIDCKWPRFLSPSRHSRSRENVNFRARQRQQRHADIRASSQTKKEKKMVNYAASEKLRSSLAYR